MVLENYPVEKIGVFIYLASTIVAHENKYIFYVVNYDLGTKPSDINNMPTNLDNRKIFNYLFTFPIHQFTEVEK